MLTSKQKPTVCIAFAALTLAISLQLGLQSPVLSQEDAAGLTGSNFGSVLPSSNFGGGGMFRARSPFTEKLEQGNSPESNFDAPAATSSSSPFPTAAAPRAADVNNVERAWYKFLDPSLNLSRALEESERKKLLSVVPMPINIRGGDRRSEIRTALLRADAAPDYACFKTVYGSLFGRSNVLVLTISGRIVRVLNMNGKEKDVLFKLPNGQIITIGPGTEMIISRSLDSQELNMCDGIARRGFSRVMKCADLQMAFCQFSHASAFELPEMRFFARNPKNMEPLHATVARLDEVRGKTGFKMALRPGEKPEPAVVKAASKVAMLLEKSPAEKPKQAAEAIKSAESARLAGAAKTKVAEAKAAEAKAAEAARLAKLADAAKAAKAAEAVRAAKAAKLMEVAKAKDAAARAAELARAKEEALKAQELAQAKAAALKAKEIAQAKEEAKLAQAAKLKEEARLKEIARAKEEALKAEIKKAKEAEAKQREIAEAKAEAEKAAEIAKAKEEARKARELAKKEKEEAARAREIARAKEEAAKAEEIAKAREEAAKAKQIALAKAEAAKKEAREKKLAESAAAAEKAREAAALAQEQAIAKAKADAEKAKIAARKQEALAQSRRVEKAKTAAVVQAKATQQPKAIADSLKQAEGSSTAETPAAAPAKKAALPVVNASEVAKALADKMKEKQKRILTLGGKLKENISAKMAEVAKPNPPAPKAPEPPVVYDGPARKLLPRVMPGPDTPPHISRLLLYADREEKLAASLRKKADKCIEYAEGGMMNYDQQKKIMAQAKEALQKAQGAEDLAQSFRRQAEIARTGHDPM